MQFNAIVWIDHRQAHVFRFNPAATERLMVLSSLRHPHLGFVHGDRQGARHLEDGFYYEDVECALNGAGQILVAGPANAKYELVEHMRACAKPLARRVIGVEIADHPTYEQLLPIAFKHFGDARPRVAAWMCAA